MTGPIRPTPPAPMPPSGDDVGWGYHRPGGDDVGWGRASSCASGGCVKAVRDGDTVRVWDGKLGDDSPVQEWPLKDWAELLRAIRVDSGQRAWHYINDFSAVVLTRGSVELTFTSDEWDDFAGGVLAGDFEAGNLSSADTSPALEESADEAVGRSGHRAAAAAGEGDLSSPSPVAPIGAPTTEAIVQLVRPEWDASWPAAGQAGAVVVSNWAYQWATAAFAKGVAAGFAMARAGDREPAWASGPLVQHLEDSPIATSGDRLTGATEPRLVGATRDEILP